MRFFYRLNVIKKHCFTSAFLSIQTIKSFLRRHFDLFINKASSQKKGACRFSSFTLLTASYIPDTIPIVIFFHLIERLYVG